MKRLRMFFLGVFLLQQQLLLHLGLIITSSLSIFIICCIHLSFIALVLSETLNL